MGLFSSEFKTTVATSVSRVIEDKRLPTTNKTSLLQTIMQNADIGDAILSNRNKNFAVRADSMYKYAKKSYAYGLPTGEMYSNTQGSATILSVISAAEGSAVSLQYNLLDTPNLLHLAWMRIVEQQGYNTVTNELTALSAAKGFPVYLDDLVLVMPYATYLNLPNVSLDKWGSSPRIGGSPAKRGTNPGANHLYAHSENEIDDSLSGVHARVKFSWFGITKIPGQPDKTDKLISASIDIPLGGMNMDADYIHAKYTVHGLPKYVTYLVGSGTYPALDALIGTPQAVIGEFFPIVHFRHAKANLNTNKTSAAYKTSKKLCSKVGINFDQIVNGIAENPNIATIEQAMLMLAVPANTVNKLELRYLFEFFNKLYSVSPEKHKSIAVRNIENLQNSEKQIKTASNSIVIADTLFEMSLRNQGIFKIGRTGTIGPVGTYASALEYDIKSVLVKGNGNDGPAGEDFSVEVKTAIHVYKKQITQFNYEEVRVLGLEATYFVAGKFHTTKGIGGDPNLLIPLDITITDIFKLKDKETLYARSMHYVINSLTVQEIKWYQSDGFGFFIQVVAIAIAIYTGTPPLTIFLQAVAANILSEMLGPKLTAILGLLIGGYQSISTLTIAVANNLVILAKDLIALVNCLVSAGQLVLMNKFEDLKEAAKQFAEESNSAWEKLLTAQGLLESNNSLGPFVILGESPTDYYNRTIHTGNMGIRAINGIHTYVEDSLKLPTFSQTIGGYA